MVLDSIEALNFRNLSGKISWGRGLNIILGNNGQGKTNWLEAIYVLARTKSFRTKRLQESIRFGENFAILSGRVIRGFEVSRDLRISIQGHVKSTSINTKREPFSRYVGHLDLVTFTADDLEVIRGMPEARRRFIDRGVASLHPSYIQTISDYNKVIKQKNRILQEASAGELGNRETEDLLAPWNSQLITLATQVQGARGGYVERLNEVLERHLFERKDMVVRYLSSLSGMACHDDYEALIAERLRIRFQAEIAAGYSLIGPHRDDLAIYLEGRDIRIYGSSGEQRSALLLLDLAAISLYNLGHDDYPLFLIDDVDAELDEKRIKHLLEYLDGRTQTFITTSKRSHVEGFLSRGEVYEIEAGAVVLNGRKTDPPSLLASAEGA
jgi:DNA replication and repair protein RecF